MITNGENWIDFSGLPHKIYGDKTIIDWKNSVGCEIPFQYNNINNKIKIEGYQLYNGKRSLVYITIDKYVPSPYGIGSGKLKTFQFKRLIDNKIIDNAPHLVKYLVNPDDAYIYSCCSNEKIQIKCLTCGAIDTVTVSNWYLQGKTCERCGDGVSYPEKFMRSVLDQLKINYVKQANKSMPGFEWAMSYRYDFAFYLNGEGFIVETDGGFHRYQVDIDQKKDELAIGNGFRMIRIDCDYGGNNRYQFIKERIHNSLLGQLFDLNNINWDLCSKQATDTDIQEVCRLWEECKMSAKEIRERVGLSKYTIWRYLTYGKEIGLCPTYDPTLSHIRGIQKGNNNKGKHTTQRKSRKPRENGITKPICLFFEGKVVTMFGSAPEAERRLPMFIGRTYTKKYIPNICSGYRKMSNGFDMKHVTKEEYLQYKMIEQNNNEVVLKKEMIKK